MLHCLGIREQVLQLRGKSSHEYVSKQKPRRRCFISPAGHLFLILWNSSEWTSKTHMQAIGTPYANAESLSIPPDVVIKFWFLVLRFGIQIPLYEYYFPCRCLCFGFFEQMMYTLPLLRTLYLSVSNSSSALPPSNEPCNHRTIS